MRACLCVLRVGGAFVSFSEPYSRKAASSMSLRPKCVTCDAFIMLMRICEYVCVREREQERGRDLCRRLLFNHQGAAVSAPIRALPNKPAAATSSQADCR